ncbi:hypothetical protein [Bartonella elizabethae]|nr:hypothetical protein [Bartonella elizabethae]
MVTLEESVARAGDDRYFSVSFVHLFLTNGSDEQAFVLWWSMLKNDT